VDSNSRSRRAGKLSVSIHFRLCERREKRRRGFPRFLLLRLPFHGTAGVYGIDGWRFAELFQFLRALPVVFENIQPGIGFLTSQKTVRSSPHGRHVSFGKHGQFVKVFGSPRIGGNENRYFERSEREQAVAESRVAAQFGGGAGVSDGALFENVDAVGERQ
jgi:hypothetical protein